MALRKASLPPGTSAEATKHFLEVRDAVEQIYPDAEDFVIMVKTDKGRIFWDMTDAFTAIGLLEHFKIVQVHYMAGQNQTVGPNPGDIV